jgi:multimeric flavodoxin WrbA
VASDVLNIYVVIGSPRNESSFTYQGLRILEAKMNSIRPTRFEYLFLQKLALPFCDGCLYCVSKGEEHCPDFAKIDPVVKKFEAADGIILAAPVHTFNVAGLMKNFVEYFMYKRNRPSFFGKKAVVFATAAGGGHKVVLDFLEGTAEGWGCDVVSRIGISSSQMGLKHGEAAKPQYMEHLDAAVADVGGAFIEAIESQSIQAADFKQLMNFRAMQNMTRRQKGSVNYNYWQRNGWLEADFYSEAPVNFFAYWMARYIGSRIRKAMKLGNVKPVR